MSFTPEALIALLNSWGLLLLFPLAVLEGPIVTILAGWLVRSAILPFWWTFLTLILADLAGDLILYGLGRGGARFLPRRWRHRMGLDDDRLTRLGAHFGARGGRTLVLTKLSHSLGIAVLPAAGVARMPVGAFLFWNLVGTLPKTFGFLGLGYFIGHAHSAIEGWLARASVAVAVLAVVGAWVYLRRRKAARGPVA